MEATISPRSQTEEPTKHHNGPFPPELLVNIFIYLDGPSLSCCSQVCSQWHMVISQFDHEIWPFACRRDFETVSTRRFWSLQFPEPPSSCSSKQKRRTWQDMYRITRNWYTGLVSGFYPDVVTSEVVATGSACAVIGAPQEQGMFTSLTLANDGRVIRSNPNYHSPNGQSLMIQSPQTKQRFFLHQQGVTQQQQQINRLENNTTHRQQQQHSIVCHYTHPNSKWLVTGGLNGTVAIWDLNTKSLVRMWPGHRGRVLCISMNDQAVVSGGSDSMIRVWDLDNNTQKPTRRRGMIDISSYLSGQSDWYQGVGEIAVNGNLVACAPDASGPILVFSLLTGSLVYELREALIQQSEWVTEDIMAFTRLCLTPFFLLTKGKVHHPAGSASTDSDASSWGVKLIPSKHNVVLQRTKKQTMSVGYVTKLSEATNTPSAHVAQMTPYQLYQYYQSINKEEEEDPIHMPTSSACINVWNLATGKIAYRLLPTLEKPNQNYTITDVRTTPDYSKVFASIEVRGSKHYEERLYCWDFAGFSSNGEERKKDTFDIVELDSLDPVLRKNGKSWVCFM